MSKRDPKDEWKTYNKTYSKVGDLAVGQKYYLVHAKWFKAWEEFAKGDGSPPDRIDNNDLLLEPLAVQAPNNTSSGTSSEVILKLHLQENTDYVLWPESVWSLFYTWYMTST